MADGIRHVQFPRFAPLLILLAATASPAVAAPGEHFRILYAERVEFDDAAVRADTGRAAPAVAAPERIRTRFDAYGRRFELSLERNDRLLGSAVRDAGTPRVYRGELAGVSGSWVRLTVAGGRRYGMVWDGRDLYVIEPAADASASLVGPAPASGDAPVVYRLADTLAPPGAAQCGAISLPGTAAPAAALPARSGLDAYRALVGELQDAASTPATAGVTATKRLQVSAVADFEYGQAVGIAAARDRIIARFNNIDGIFASQTGVQIELASPVRVFDTKTQPFSSTSASALLGEVGTYRQSLAAQSASEAGGLTHLVTGRNLDGTTVGIAYIGALCSTRFGVSLSEGQNSFGDLIAAHEIGHNFGAPHDGEVPADGGTNACQSVAQEFLMAPRINGSRNFSQCSLDQIAPQVARAACLLPANSPATVDLAVAVPGGTVRMLQQRTAALSATVRNVGTAAASTARLRFSVPTGLQVVGGSGENGALCGTQPDGYECTWTAFGASAAASVQLTLRGTTAGNYTVSATALATGDVTGSNDAANYSVAVEPLPDLALDVGQSTLTIDVDQQGVLSGTVRNPGSAPADGGTVRFDLPAVVRAVAPAPSGCTIDAASVTCAVGTVAGGAATTVQVPVRGAAAGAGTARLTLTSADDSDATNNSGAVALTVPTPAPPSPPPAAPTATSSGGGGGGSLGLAGLAALLGLLLGRRRSRA